MARRKPEYEMTAIAADGSILVKQPLPHGERYYATIDGRIFSHRGRRGGKELNQYSYNEYGHCKVYIGGKTMLAHRLIYEAFNGLIPDGMEIDHINRNPRDNRLMNLRLATRLQNARNCTAHKKSASREPGVTFYGRQNRWQATIRVNGKLKHLGLYREEHDAIVARRVAASEYFREFAPA